MKAVVLSRVSEVLDLWDFFLKGLVECNKSVPYDDQKVDSDTFLKRMMRIISMPWELRIVLIITDDNGKPLGYSVSYDVSKPFAEHKTMGVYIAYNDEKQQGVMKKMINEGEEIAKLRGYEELQCFSHRFSGSAYAMFEERYKFRRLAVIYSKRI